VGIVCITIQRDKRGSKQLEWAEKSELDLTQLTGMMHAHGVRRLYVKRLAPNDNSKNQVYFGPGFEAANIFPSLGVRAERSQANPIFKAPLNFFWMDSSAGLHQAPGAQLILYPQYPEVRLSGFLKGSRGPSSLINSSAPGRVLLLGVTDDGRIVGYPAPADSAVTRELEILGELPREGVFMRLVLGAVGFGADARERLLAELNRIHGLGWISSKRLLPDGTDGPCDAPNCGGLTLEAELGIRPNSLAEPDFMGWEIKQHRVTDFLRPEGVGAITLMTP
jgi:hypothetical protein